MKQYFYDLYISIFDETADIIEISKRLECITDLSCVNIQNITDLKEEEKMARLNGCISMERVRLYSYCQKPVYVSVFALDDKHHIMILSVCKNVLNENEINNLLSILFKNDSFKTISLRGNVKNNHEESINYWNQIFAKRRLSLPRRMMPNPEEYYTDDLEFNSDLLRQIERCVKERKRSLKTILYLAVGALMCKGLNATRILVNDIHEGGMLSCIPLVIDSSRKKYDQYEDVKRQLINAEYYDNCSSKEMWENTEIDPSNTPIISALFMYDGKYTEFIKSIDENVVYMQPAIDAEYMNFCIIPRLGVNGFSVSYVYSDAVFDKVSIKEFHKALGNYLGEYLKEGLGEDGINDEISLDDTILALTKSSLNDNDISENESDNKAEKSNKPVGNKKDRDDMKLQCLSKIKMFGQCKENDIKKIAEHAKVHFLGMGQRIINCGDYIEHIYIVLKGSLEGWIQSDKSYESLVECHQAGAIVGVENFYNEKYSNITFRSGNSDTILISIPSSNILKITGEHPEIIGSIIQNMGRNLETLKQQRI